jgi:hypothetical protein
LCFPIGIFFTVGSIFRAFGWILCRVQNLVFLVGLGRISAPLEGMRGRARPLDWSEGWPTLKGVLEGCFSIRSVCFAVALFFLIWQGFHVLGVLTSVCLLAGAGFPLRSDISGFFCALIFAANCALYCAF